MRRLLPALMLLVSCSGAPDVLTVDGVVADPATLIPPAEELVAALASDRVSVSPSAACFMVRADGAFLPELLCGPVGGLTLQGRWVSFPLEAASGSVRVGAAAAVGVEPPAGASLLRPDGSLPSEEVVPPPPLGEFQVLPFRPTAATSWTSRSWEIRAPLAADAVSTVVEVTGSSSVTSVGSGRGLLSAPDGFELLLLRMRFDTSVPASSLSLEVAGRSLPLPELSSHLLASVPAGAEVRLVLSEADGRQELSLVDGSRSGSYEPFWYAPVEAVVTSGGVSSFRHVTPELFIPGSGSVPRVIAGAFTLEVSDPVVEAPAVPSRRGVMFLPVRPVLRLDEVLPQQLEVTFGFTSSSAVDGVEVVTVDGPDGPVMYVPVPSDATSFSVVVTVSGSFYAVQLFEDVSGGFEAGSAAVSGLLLPSS